MPEDRGEPREWNLRQFMSWTDLFSAFSIALEPYKLGLAAAAILLVWFGWYLLSLIFNINDQFREWPPNAQRGQNPVEVVTRSPRDLMSIEYWLGRDAKQPPVQLEPFDKFISPVMGLFRTNPYWGRWWYLFFGVLMTLAVWAIFGGAITRIAAVQYARKEKIGIMEALKFSMNKFLQFFSAPLIPFAGIAIIALLMIIGGLLLLIPYVGDLLASLLWFLPLVGGLIMTLILIGLIGWPLMYATISAEGSDSFDALSRCYAYVYQRFWHYLGYNAIALVYGLLVIFFVVFVTSAFVYLAKWGVALSPSWRTDPVSPLFYYAPASYGWREMLLRDHPAMAFDQSALEAKLAELREIKDDAARQEQLNAYLETNGLSRDQVTKLNQLRDIKEEAAQRDQLTRLLEANGASRDQLRSLSDVTGPALLQRGTTELLSTPEAGRRRMYAQMNGAQVISAYIVGFWLNVLFLLMLGFAYSYYWSASTIIYFQLRKKVDDTDLDEVYLEDEEEEHYPMPAPQPPTPSSSPTSTPLQLVEPPRASPPPAEPPSAPFAPPASEPARSDLSPVEPPPKLEVPRTNPIVDEDGDFQPPKPTSPKQQTETRKEDHDAD